MQVRWLAVIAALMLGMLPVGVHAWGAQGHRVVAALAQARLDPAVRAAVADLLAQEPDPTLPGVAVWADTVREQQPDYQWSVPLHWVNFDQGDCHYRQTRNCPGGRCVIAAIERFSQELADPKRPRSERVVALKFLVHFVGDIHQPLHAGYARDRGGNEFQISYQRAGTNLHSVWDSRLIDSLQLDWPAYARRLERVSMDPHASRNRNSRDPAHWAEESCQISHAEGFYPRHHKINHTYLDAHRPLADQRLKLAGERLAALLNRVLAGGR